LSTHVIILSFHVIILLQFLVQSMIFIKSLLSLLLSLHLFKISFLIIITSNWCGLILIFDIFAYIAVFIVGRTTGELKFSGHDDRVLIQSSL